MLDISPQDLVRVIAILQEKKIERTVENIEKLYKKLKENK